MNKPRALSVIALMSVSCGLETDPPPQTSTAALTVTLDARRSFAITDKEILAPFSFKRVLDTLVAQSGVPGLTSLDLFRQWWDTQNPNPGFGANTHCDDHVSATGSPTFNAYPYTCRPLEGAQASPAVDPFTNPDTNPDAYFPIGLFNRFDLSAKNGSFCGEYRIIFAKRSGVTNDFQRNLIIFEGALANPDPHLKLSGCQKVAKFWADLSKEDKLDKRTKALEKFYFEGVTGRFAPAVHVSAYGDNSKGFGQIRVNSFVNPAGATSPQVPWSLREFKLMRSGCNPAGNACTAMKILPATVKSNPFGGLFSAAAVDSSSPSFYPQAAAFQTSFADMVPELLAGDLTEIGMTVPDAFNTAQSLSSGNTEGRYDLQLGSSPSTLRTAIADKLTATGSSLTVDHVVRRAMTVSCAGCHRFNNNAPNNDLGGGLVWPASLGFTHISERDVEADVPTRFLISRALKDLLLPTRMTILDTYLRTGKGKADETDTHSDKPIKGGSRDD